MNDVRIYLNDFTLAKDNGDFDEVDVHFNICFKNDEFVRIDINTDKGETTLAGFTIPFENAIFLSKVLNAVCEMHYPNKRL